MNDFYIKAETISSTYEKYKTQIDLCLEGVSDNEIEQEKERIIKDLLYVDSNSVFSINEYFMYDFAHKTRLEQSAYLSDKSTLEMFYRFNDSKKLSFNTRDKWKVYQYLKPFYHREICFVSGIEHKQDFISLLKDKKRLFCKPLCGSLGIKTRIVRDTDCITDEDFGELLDYYAPEGFLAEELIQQSKSMMQLNPTSVNTLRVMTIRMDDRICMYFETRIGAMFSIVDNLSWGSLICGIDHTDGTIISAFNKSRKPFKTHPHTRVPVVGTKIPCFSQAVDLAKELAQYFPEYRYLSWDFALTDEGWVIVELNGKGGVCGFQEVYGCGIRHDIEKYLNEINQPIEFEGLIKSDYIPLETGESCPHAEYPFSL